MSETKSLILLHPEYNKERLILEQDEGKIIKISRGNDFNDPGIMNDIFHVINCIYSVYIDLLRLDLSFWNIVSVYFYQQNDGVVNRKYIIVLNVAKETK